MARVRLQLSTIKDLEDGRVEAQFNKLISLVVEDCVERAHDLSARTLTMQIRARPEKGGEGVCTGMEVEFEIDAKLPKRRSKRFSMTCTGNGVLAFNPASEDDRRQTTLDEARS